MVNLEERVIVFGDHIHVFSRESSGVYQQYHKPADQEHNFP